MITAVNDLVVRVLGRVRLEIQTSDSTSDSPKSSDRFDNHDAKIRNRETASKQVSQLRVLFYMAAGVDHGYKH